MSNDLHGSKVVMRHEFGGPFSGMCNTMIREEMREWSRTLLLISYLNKIRRRREPRSMVVIRVTRVTLPRELRLGV